VFPEVGGGGRVVRIDAAGDHERAADVVPAVGEGYRSAVDVGAGCVHVVDEVNRQRWTCLCYGVAVACGAIEPQFAVAAAQQRPDRNVQIEAGQDGVEWMWWGPVG